MTEYEFHEGIKQQQVFRRFEAKYIISELEAEAIADYIGPYVVPDPHAQEGAAYPVSSLYLDSPDLRMFWSSELGEKNRFKLRVRAYSDNPGDPVFFEIKRRIGPIVWKQRAGVSRALAEGVLRGGEVGPHVLAEADDEGMDNLCTFRDYLHMMSATPCVMVRYSREAYISSLEEPVRITFDRYISCLPVARYTPDVWSFVDGWRDIHDPLVILEVKFTDVMPFWVRRLIQRFHLLIDSVAKYVTCMKTLRGAGIRVGALLETTAI